MTLGSFIDYRDVAIMKNFFMRSDTMTDNFTFARRDRRVMHVIMNARLKRPGLSLMYTLCIYPVWSGTYHTKSLEKMMRNGGEHRRDLMYLLSLRTKGKSW